MGKESKIGIIVVGVLMGVFLGLLIKRFVLTPSLPAVEADVPRVAAQPEATPDGEQPTVVTAQRDTTGPAADGAADNPWGTGRRADTGVDVPHGSFLPADEPPVNPRYAEQPEPTPAGDQSIEPTPAVDPFHARFTRDAVAEDSSGGTPAATPNEIDVMPEGAEALDARKPPPRAVRNPLRRLSAEMPLEDAPAEGDVSPPENLYPEFDAPSDASDQRDFDRTGIAPAHGNGDGLSLQPAAAPPVADDPNARQPEFDETSDDTFGATARGGGDPFGSGVPQPQNADTQTPAPPQVPQRYQPPADYGQFDAAQTPRAIAPQPALPVDGRYTVQPNDSLWTISEKVYGDGRYYKAIGAHNREKLPQPDRLTVGTVLEVPATSVLEQNYASLCPRKRRSAVVPSRTVRAAAGQALPAGTDVYVVEEGDTLFDIARYELGKAARWGEIYELNRDALGEDFDFLQPGLELRLPPKTPGGTIGRQGVDRVQR